MLILRNESLNIKPDTDSKFKELLYAINALPGIYVSGYWDPKEGQTFITFNVKDGIGEGLFFLTRCVDRRYWEYGNSWKISLSVGDLITEDNRLPIGYILEREDINKTKDEIYNEVKSLYDNLHYHLTHKAFMSGFNINIDNFNIVTKISLDRDEKLNRLI